LFSVVMRHSYFTDGLLRALAAYPTPETAERLRRARLLFYTLPDGFTVLTTGGPPPATLFPLTFSLQPQESCFLTYSSLPLLTGAAHTYCFGLPTGSTGPHLQAAEVVGAADQLALRPLVFRQPLLAGAAPTAELRRCSDGLVVQQLAVPPQADSLLLNLRPWGSGRYHLTSGSETVSIYADDYLAATRPWGMLTLDARVLASPAASYTLAFAARATYWQYQVVARQLPLPGELTITTGTDLVFEAAPALPGVAASLLATQAQPLAQRYSTPPYQLVLPAGGTGGRPQIVYPALPQASPNALRQIKDSKTAGGMQLITDIFVQL
jgi:hypothetical protein